MYAGFRTVVISAHCITARASLFDATARGCRRVDGVECGWLVGSVYNKKHKRTSSFQTPSQNTTRTNMTEASVRRYLYLHSALMFLLTSLQGMCSIYGNSFRHHRTSICVLMIQNDTKLILDTFTNRPVHCAGGHQGPRQDPPRQHAPGRIYCGAVDGRHCMLIPYVM